MALIFNLPMSGPDGSTTITDTTGNFSWSVNGNAQIQSNALLLDGSDDYVSAPVDSRVKIGTISNFRIAFDMRMAAADKGGYRIILDQINTSISAWTWQVYTQDGVLAWSVYHPSYGGIQLYGGSIDVADGNWHTVEIIRESGAVRIVLDGATIATGSDGRGYAVTPIMGIGTRVYQRYPYDYKGSLRNISLEITEPVVSYGRVSAFVAKSLVGWDRARNRSVIRRSIFYSFPPMETKKAQTVKVTRGVPPWWGPSGSTTQLPTYKLRGRVMQRDPDGVLPDAPVQYARVVLFFRRLHTLVDIQLSDVDGYVQFDNLMPGGQAYYAIAFDPEGAPLQNAVIWDRLTPEPGP